MLGSAIVAELKGRFELFSLDVRPGGEGVSQMLSLDLTDGSKVVAAIDGLQPDYVINCAALTNVELCEKEPDKAEAVNARAAANVARACGSKIRLVHISTAAVFDGKKGNYSEVDQPRPLNAYARTKLAAEDMVKKYATDHVIVRTDIIGWKQGQYMVQGLYEQLAGGKPIKGFTNAVFSPISVNSMANYLAELLGNEYKGVLHIGSLKPVTKYEFSSRFARAFGLNEALVVKSEQADAVVRRPKNTGLDVRKAVGIFGRLPEVEEEIGLLAKTRRAGQ